MPVPDAYLMKDGDTALDLAYKIHTDIGKNFIRAMNGRTERVIGVGGGSKIDMGKKLAYDLDVPFISVPSAPSHDGIASPRASIYDRQLILS